MNYKTVISAALIILAHTAQSQNWKPLYENEVYNFTSSSSTNPIITNYLWIDSVKPGTTYLNLSIKKCDQCNDPGVGTSVTECYKIKQAQFLQKEIRDLGNGVYQFYGPGNFYIYSTAQLNESWVFDSSKIITAKVINLDSKDFWGTTDSTKTIQLSTGEILILSKNHGITKFPNFADTNNSYFELAGFDKTRKGLTMPTKEECFSFNAGDVFEYQEYHYSQRWPSPVILIKDSIEEVIDNFTFKKKRSTRFINYSYFTPQPVDYTFEEQIIDYRDTNILDVKQYPSDLNAENEFISEYYDSTFKRIIRKIETQNHYLKNDTLYVLFMPPHLNSAWEIGKNIGIKRYEVSDQDPDNSWYIALTGSVIKNDTLGSVTWNKLFAQDLIAADSITSLLNGCWQSNTNSNHWLQFSKEGYKYHCAALFNETSAMDEFNYFAVNHEIQSSWLLRKMDGTEFATREYSGNLFCKLDSSYYTKKSDCDVKSDTHANSLYTINYSPKTGIIIIGKSENIPTIQISIYNTKGQCLTNTEQCENPCHIDLKGITKGICLIRITNEDKAFVKKIFIP